jgi:GAF domain-containing protein
MDAQPMDGQKLRALLRRFATSLVEDHELELVLAELGPEMAGVIGLRGAGVMLEDDAGDLRFVSASDPTLLALETLQLELSEGPCLLAYERGEVVLADDLASDDRFPAFGRRAVVLGMAGVYSFPVLVGERTVGAVNLYDDRPRRLSAEQVDTGALLAQLAAAYLTHMRDDQLHARERLQLQHALDSRVIIEQAKGFVAAVRAVDVEVARDILRGYARTTRRSLHDVSQQVLAGELSVADLD